MGQVRGIFFLEVAMAVVSGVLLVLTVVSREWIEIVFGVDPDGGTGALEWLVVIGLMVATLSLSWVARQEWRHRTL